jgi:uncharacterized membrane protein
MAAPAWRAAAAGAALAGYALLSHWLMVNAAQAPWAVAVLFGPLVAAVAATGWQRRQPLVLAACAAGVLLLAGIVLRGGVADINRMYVLQHAGIHLALAWAFGSTLRGGATPLITTLARGVHQRLGLRFDAEVERYTRGLTAMWAAYFVAMVLLSFTIYALAPWPWWSVFCNIVTPLAAGVVMVVEHVVRYRRHPHFERVSLRAAIAAYSRSA